jgi:hypothetical protein
MKTSLNGAIEARPRDRDASRDYFLQVFLVHRDRQFHVLLIWTDINWRQIYEDKAEWMELVCKWFANGACDAKNGPGNKYTFVSEKKARKCGMRAR